MAKAGTPAGLITTTVFQNLALSEMAALGAASLPLLVVHGALDPLPARSSCGMEVRVRVPRGASPGTYASVILVSNVPERISAATAARSTLPTFSIACASTSRLA